MSDDLRNEIQSALSSLSDAELATLCALPSARSGAQEAIRHNNQWLSEVWVENGEPTFRVVGRCVRTDKHWYTNEYSRNQLFTGLRLWGLGITAQRALRFMSASEREFLTSGICPEGWRETYIEEAGDREPFFPAPECNACGNCTPCRCDGTGNG